MFDVVERVCEILAFPNVFFRVIPPQLFVFPGKLNEVESNVKQQLFVEGLHELLALFESLAVDEHFDVIEEDFGGNELGFEKVFLNLAKTVFENVKSKVFLKWLSVILLLFVHHAGVEVLLDEPEQQSARVLLALPHRI